MRRRSRRAPNTSESTGKIGQEIPSNQPAPLVPYYPDDAVRPREPARPVGERSERVERRQTPRPEQARREQARTGQARPEQARSGQARPGLARPEQSRLAQVRQPEQPRPDWNEPADSGRLEMETQPELSPAPTPKPNAAGQTPKGFVVLAIGLPGSGKTTWFGRRGITPLSSDLLRNILFDDVEEQRYQGLVFSTLRSLLRARLIARMPMNYVDATNLSIHERRQWIKMAKSFGYEVQAVYFDVPLEVCLDRNRQRDRSVSEDVMRKMAERLKPPVFEEGFEKITVVRVKSAE
jgi:predicted kinase